MRTEELEKGRGLNFTLFDICIRLKAKKAKIIYYKTERFRLTFHHEDFCLPFYLPFLTVKVSI